MRISLEVVHLCFELVMGFGDASELVVPFLRGLDQLRLLLSPAFFEEALLLRGFLRRDDDMR